mmetsp:Transcript_10511/g.20176  ORF Transcript_10511/g.20176 Transcript_10511/m.20176 type:complete len:128 (+) Transcript_10511:72-455(+)
MVSMRKLGRSTVSSRCNFDKWAPSTSHRSRPLALTVEMPDFHLNFQATDLLLEAQVDLVGVDSKGGASVLVVRERQLALEDRMVQGREGHMMDQMGLGGLFPMTQIACTRIACTPIVCTRTGCIRTG